MGEFFKFMIHYFHGSRRRFGLVTLLLACVAMGVWVRGHVVQDVIQFGSNDREFHHLHFSLNGLMWRRFEIVGYGRISYSNRLWTEPSDHYQYFHSPEKSLWRLQFGGFDIGKSYDESKGKMQMTYWTIPYWPIVVPLTALSAILLLKKPSKSTQMKTAKPIPSEGT